MTINYQYVNEDLSTMIVEHVDRFNEDGSVSWIPINPSNSDYQSYLAWLEEHNG
jgi:secreted PhoX family phosphatase